MIVNDNAGRVSAARAILPRRLGWTTAAIGVTGQRSGTRRGARRLASRPALGPGTGARAVVAGRWYGDARRAAASEEGGIKERPAGRAGGCVETLRSQSWAGRAVRPSIDGDDGISGARDRVGGGQGSASAAGAGGWRGTLVHEEKGCGVAAEARARAMAGHGRCSIRGGPGCGGACAGTCGGGQLGVFGDSEHGAHRRQRGPRRAGWVKRSPEVRRRYARGERAVRDPSVPLLARRPTTLPWFVATRGVGMREQRGIGCHLAAALRAASGRPAPVWPIGGYSHFQKKKKGRTRAFERRDAVMVCGAPCGARASEACRARLQRCWTRAG